MTIGIGNPPYPPTWEPPIGPWLSELFRISDKAQRRVFADATTVARSAKFHEPSGRHQHSEFAYAFQDNAFSTYNSSPILGCNTLDVTLIGSDGILLCKGAVIRDTVSHVMTWETGSVVESFQSTSHVRIRRDKVFTERCVADGDYMIGFTASWRNYAHWMQQCLPKIYCFKLLLNTIPNLRLVLPSFAANSFQQQTLDLLGVGVPQIYTVAHGDLVQFHSVWLTTDADIWSVPPFARVAALALVDATPPRRNHCPVRNDRIYVHRAEGSRSVSNFDEIKQAAERCGFHVVSFEHHTLPEQIALMQRARYVVAEHGAGLVNILFCRPGTYVLELFNPACVQPAFWSVASICQLNYGYLVGNHGGSPTDSIDWNSPYTISGMEFRKALGQMDGLLLSDDAVPTPSVIPPTKNKLIFVADADFDISGLSFTLTNFGPCTSNGRIPFYKDRQFVYSYYDELVDLPVRSVVEFGECSSRNSIFLTALMNLSKYICIDASESAGSFLQNLRHVGLDSRIKPYFGVAQTDVNRIQRIISDEFPDSHPDLIIDDASHLFDKTKKTFEISFPLLRDGGYYMIEDWSWAHWPENQMEEQPWGRHPALTNFIFELVIALASGNLLDSVVIRHGFVLLRKKMGGTMDVPFLVDNLLRMRGRALNRV